MDTEIVTSENLAAFNAKRLNIAAVEVPEAPKDEAKTEKAAQVVAPVENEDKTEAKSDETEVKQAEVEQKPVEEPKKKPKKSIDERFSELTTQRKEALAAKEAAEARARALEERVKAIEEGKPKVDPDAKPNPDNFKDAFTYAEALANWSAREAIKAERERTAKEQADKAQEAIRGTWAKNVAAIIKTYEDYEETVRDSNVQVSDPIRDAILESDNGPLLIYHLAKNPEEADKLNELSPRKALLELGKLEAKLTVKSDSKKDEVKLSQAPPPINPLRGSSASGGVPINGQGEFTGTYAEYKAARLAGKIK